MKSSRVPIRKKHYSASNTTTGASSNKKNSLQVRKKKTIAKAIATYSKTTLRSILLSHLFQSSAKAVFLFAAVGFSLYGAYHLIGKTFANEVVISKSEIVSRVAKLTQLPDEEPEKVVRVQDGEDLKKQNEFYKDVKEGDYIIVYSTMAIVYDLRNNVIISMRQSQDPQPVSGKESKSEGILDLLQPDSGQ